MSVLGAMNHAQQGIRHARAFMSGCFEALSTARAAHHWVRLSPLARLDLQWWRDMLLAYNGVTFFHPPPASYTIFSDACPAGYGFYCPELRIYGHGTWPSELAGTHINPLELEAALAGLVAVLARLPPGAAVHVHSRADNTVAVAAIAHGRARAGPSARLARALQFLLATSPALHAFSSSHIQGVLNVIADALSRGTVPPDVDGWTCVHTPADWLVSTITSERPWKVPPPT